VQLKIPTTSREIEACESSG
jgi:hypothetical protein